MKSIYQVVANRVEDYSFRSSEHIHNSLDKALKEAKIWNKSGFYTEVRIKVFRTQPNQEGYSYREAWYVE